MPFINELDAIDFYDVNVNSFLLASVSSYLKHTIISNSF